jgi:hypothetical protein
MLRGRAGAEAKLHAVAHMFERTRRRLPFQFIHIHVQNIAPEAAAGCDRRYPARAYLASFCGEEQRYQCLDMVTLG